jgi:hypothetical protein
MRTQCPSMTYSSKSWAAPRRRGGEISHSEGADGDAFLVQVFTDADVIATRRYDVRPCSPAAWTSSPS